MTINNAKKHIKKYIKKPHFQVFAISFSLCILFFFIISKQSGSNIAPVKEVDFPLMENQIIGTSSNPIPKRINNFFDDMFSGVKEHTLEVKSGDSIASMLSSFGICYSEILAVSKAIDPISKTSELKPDNDKIVIKLKPIPNQDGKVKAELCSLEIIKSPIYKIRAEKTADGFRTVEEKSDITSELIRKEGEILKGTGLIEAALAQGIPYNIIDKFYEIFSFDVDFERDIYPGDKFQIMYENLYSDNGDYIGNGDVIFASLYLNSRQQDFKLYRYENENGFVAYYDENGKSASKTLKKSPINGARISSKYGKRKHPILGYSRAHQGIDFAAPSGTPIPAAGSGKVVFKGWRNGYGNYIKIKHNGTYSTAYGHMKGFKSGINVGSQIAQGQIIGYVGSTGLSTGPHLHYEIIKDNVHVNPLTVKLPSIKNITKAELKKFATNRDKINIQFAVLDKNFSQFANLINVNNIEPVASK